MLKVILFIENADITNIWRKFRVPIYSFFKNNNEIEKLIEFC